MLRVLCSPTPAAFRDSRAVNWRMLHADAALGQNNDRSKSISKRYTSNLGLPSSHGFAGGMKLFQSENMRLLRRQRRGKAVLRQDALSIGRQDEHRELIRIGRCIGDDRKP